MTSSPLFQLTLARVREFLREPEAIFWTFLFPIVISMALALAFPSTASRPVIVGIEPGESTAALRDALTKTSGVDLRDVPPGEQQRELREGEVHIVVLAGTPPTYRFDPARVESRVARLVVDDALKRAAGRTD